MEVKRMNIKNQIKAQIMFAGFTMAEVVDALSTEYGWSDSLSNFSAKLSRESLRYKEGYSQISLPSASPSACPG